MLIRINNSFCKLEGFTTSVIEHVRKTLTYTDEEVIREKQMLYSQIKQAKMRRQFPYLAVLKAKFKALGPDHVCWLDANHCFPTGLLHLVKPIVGQTQTVDERIKTQGYNIFRWENKPSELRYYQTEAVNAFIKAGRGVIHSSVGTGKTRMAVEIIKLLSVNTLFVAPSTTLLEQTTEVFEQAFGRKNVQKISSNDVKKGKKLKPIRVVTIQTLNSLLKQGLEKDLINDVDLFIGDEIHHAGSKSYTALLNAMAGVYYRLGLTGTYLRNDSKTLDLWGFSGQIVYEYLAEKATKEGYLTPVEFNIIKLKGKPDKNYQKEYQLNYGGLEMLETIKDLIKAKIPHNKQVLILVDRKEKCGHLIDQYFKENKIPCTYVNGDDNKNVITKAISDFNDKKVRILLASTILGEGVDVRSTDVLILARGGKSEISITQAIGRAIRLYPGKTKALVYDFDFRFCKYLSRHVDIRAETYQKQFAGKVNWL